MAKAQPTLNGQFPVIRLSSVAFVVSLLAGTAFVIARYYRISGQGNSFAFTFEITRSLLNFGGMALFTPLIYQIVKWSLVRPKVRIVIWLIGLVAFGFFYLVFNKVFLFVFFDNEFSLFKHSSKLFLNFSHLLVLFYAAAGYASYQILTRKKITTTKAVVESQRQRLKVKIDGIQRDIILEGIAHIQTYDHYLKLHMADGNVHLIRRSLKQILPALSDDFIQVHRSSVVNKHHVEKVVVKKGKHLVILKNGTEVRISDTFRSNGENLGQPL